MKKMKEKIRGNYQNIEKINVMAQKILKRSLKNYEIQLFPFLIMCLQDQYIDRTKLRFGELDLIKEYIEKGLVFKESKTIGCTKDFWDFITYAVYCSYVIEG